MQIRCVVKRPESLQSLSWQYSLLKQDDFCPKWTQSCFVVKSKFLLEKYSIETTFLYLVLRFIRALRLNFGSGLTLFVSFLLHEHTHKTHSSLWTNWRRVYFLLLVFFTSLINVPCRLWSSSQDGFQVILNFGFGILNMSGWNNREKHLLIDRLQLGCISH